MNPYKIGLCFYILFFIFVCCVLFFETIERKNDKELIKKEVEEMLDFVRLQ